MRKTCYFSGRVQGVGFRYTAYNLAMQYDVTGFVRNLDDGRVELVIEGPQQEMLDLIADIQQKMGDYVEDLAVQDSPGTGEYQRFSIRH